MSETVWIYIWKLVTFMVFLPESEETWVLKMCKWRAICFTIYKGDQTEEASNVLPPINFGLWDYMKCPMAEHLEMLWKKKYGSLKIRYWVVLCTQMPEQTETEDAYKYDMDWNKLSGSQYDYQNFGNNVIIPETLEIVQNLIRGRNQDSEWELSFIK
eukprot:gene8516-9431_t